jgi:putative chitinase
MNFDRPKFFEGFRLRFGSIKQAQVDALDQLLAFIENDRYMDDVRWIAYAPLATTYHETAYTFLPIHEYGGRKYFIQRYGGQTPLGKRLGNDTPEEGAIYAGEGDVQLTGEANYERAETELRKQYPEVIADFERRTGRVFDLTVGDQPGDEKDPENAGDPIIAYCIMSAGMRQGWFTGKKLSDYISDKGCDFLNARRIINGLDKATTIESYANRFLKILEGAEA